MRFWVMANEIITTKEYRDWLIDYSQGDTISKQPVAQLPQNAQRYAFEPEHAGKLNFYIKAVDEQLRQDGDMPTIGILLCKGKDRVVAEYALSDIHKPMGVSEYELVRSLPDELKSALPTIEQIEAELEQSGDSI